MNPFLVSFFILPLAFAQSPTATLGTSNTKSLQAIGYNPAQASFYASAITQTPVASAYEALNQEGAIERINDATAQSEYNSLLAAAVASLPDDLKGPASSFFLGLEALAETTTASGVIAAASSSAAAAAPASPSKTASGMGTLVLASVPPSLTTGGAPVPTQASAVGVTTTVVAAHSGISSAMAPGQKGMAVGAVAGAIAGWAFAF